MATSTAHAVAKSALFTPASLMAFSRWSGGDQQPHDCVYVPLGLVIVFAISCAMGSGL